MEVFNYPFPCKRLSENNDDTKNIGFAQGVFSLMRQGPWVQSWQLKP
jgi:hypothetical protein